MKRFAIIATLAAACGGSQKPAPPPTRAPLDTAALAAELHAELTDMAAIVERTSGACAEMSAQLGALFARMRRSVHAVHEAELDATVAQQLAVDMRAYDATDAGLSARIQAGLVTCRGDAALQRTMSSMPEL